MVYSLNLFCPEWVQGGEGGVPKIFVRFKSKSSIILSSKQIYFIPTHRTATKKIPGWIAVEH